MSWIRRLESITKFMGLRGSVITLNKSRTSVECWPEKTFSISALHLIISGLTVCLQKSFWVSGKWISPSYHMLYFVKAISKKWNDERCLQEEKKSKSVKALNEECKDEHSDKKKGSLFPWPRNRSFGKGHKKKDLGEYSEFKPVDIVFTSYSLYSLIYCVCSC